MQPKIIRRVSGKPKVGFDYPEPKESTTKDRKFSARAKTATVGKEPEVSKEYLDTGSPRTLIANGVPCVYVEKGVTKNMGDYNSARVTIGMMLPIDYTPEELAKAKKAISIANEIIENRLEKEVEVLLEG